MPNLRDFKNVAILQTAFIGDAVLTLYVAQHIKNFNPDCRLTFVSTPAASGIVRCAASIDEVLAMDKRKANAGLSGIKAFAAKLREREIDCAIAPHRSLRTTLTAKTSGAKYTVGFDANAASFLYSKRVKYRFHLHEIFRNMSLLEAFDDCDVLSEKPHVELRFDSEEEKAIESALQKYDLQGKRFVAIAPGSVWETKRWTKAGYVEAARRFIADGYEVALTGSSAEKELCDSIATESGAVSFAGETNLPQTLILYQKAELVLTNDSAPVHLAGLVECPVIAVFGATSQIFGFAPTGENASIVENGSLECRPCAIHGGRRCPKGDFECMKSVGADEVISAAYKAIKKGRN